METSDNTTYTLHAHSVDAPTWECILRISWFLISTRSSESLRFSDFDSIPQHLVLANATRNYLVPKSNKIFVVACFSGFTLQLACRLSFL